MLEKAGYSQNEEPLGTLLTEHTLGRVLVGAISDSIERCKRSDPDGREDFLINARGICSLLSKHICCEETHLFIEAEEKLSETLMSEIADKFRERDGHPEATENNLKHLQMIDDLEALYLNQHQ